jgi:hypothetical protein
MAPSSSLSVSVDHRSGVQSAALFQRKYSGDLSLLDAWLEFQQEVHPSD